MTHRTLAAEPQRSSMFTETRRRGWVNALRKINGFGVLPGAESRQNALRREWRLMQAHTDGIVNRIRDRGDGSSQ